MLCKILFNDLIIRNLTKTIYINLLVNSKTEEITKSLIGEIYSVTIYL